MEINSKLQELEDCVQYMDRVNPKVSKSGVAWHIDHSLKVVIAVCGTVRKSNPNDYKKKFNWKKLYALTFKSFPRGIAKAPKSVRPPEIITIEDINIQFEKARYLISTLKDLPANSNFSHPVFGYLNLEESFEFMALHSHHHLKIVRDIIKK